MGLPRRCAALLPRPRVGIRRPSRGALLVGLWPKGRHSHAARRRCAHPLGSALAGEGAGDGAESSARFARFARARRAAEREGRREVRARVSTTQPGGGFFDQAKCRTAVGFDPTARSHRATQRPRRASVPRRFAGPGPRCGLCGCAHACRVGPGHFDGWATAQ